jgi:hypothetical protein
MGGKYIFLKTPYKKEVVFSQVKETTNGRVSTFFLMVP